MVGWPVVRENIPRQLGFSKMKSTDSDTVFSAAALALAGTIPLRRTLALIPTLSPGAREKLSIAVAHSPVSESFQRGKYGFPLLRERNRARASLFTLNKY